MDKEIENIMYLEGISRIIEQNELILKQHDKEIKKLNKQLKYLKIISGGMLIAIILFLILGKIV